MKLTDDLLIVGIKKDDYACYNQLFMRYYSRLCAFVFNLTQNYSASEDVVQELFIRLWIQRGKLEIKESTSGYLYRASKNAALNYLRAEKSRQKSIQNMPVQEWQIDEDQIEQIEFSVALNKCIEQLPDRSRDVFMKSRFDGLRQQEISDQLGISVKTIKNQIWKSLQFLKACLELHEAFEHGA
ncbi:RNA polymerase ECF-type sigma factor [Aquipluma nitroreducens]|uniref:RNA polymerase ECF-type sigma factor n=1 Tax=Aquipluma nitroreducens TaxID=2010828 RepID=A0A5K7SA95_9BACT|nr:RNA polymerase sigma-70 factor [Aquipluma nitroreducens]BBE18425.1 RNA polymerase ECF-type sigma factor [Aquipluma nitroreducens]